MDINAMRPVEWLGDSRATVRSFPREVSGSIGVALDTAQRGGKAPNAKPLKGFKGASVVEIVEEFQTDAYRAVYTVRFPEAVYVLHAFQKKSKTGIETPKPIKDLIEQRLREAQRIHDARTKRG